ncbi:MAG: 30S ribosomal protein S8e [Candidatus ainarchaeum sp.]|jgi:small subunit ribosomal protein S8e|nr:30S ribosomal protein S8e [Candidatus ainarchaeum sp.]MDD3086099.1 30S ribosomal protein S8e [Candidatus ainarchaeum sp.]MDD4128632.1 30S ribosomal protein S8e [Candidatus ainarchaeum sp.]MDD4468023.1 30S ribosomal protein S8e [Candidatus ainarchaeum sp.]
MVQWHLRDDKKPSGGRRNTVRARSKKLAWKGGKASLTKTVDSIKKDVRETAKKRGKTQKVRALEVKHASIAKDGKIIKAEIIAVSTNNANRLFARSNVSTKGAIIRVKIDGNEKLAKVTNRPGQEGIVNAKLIE